MWRRHFYLFKHQPGDQALLRKQANASTKLEYQHIAIIRDSWSKKYKINIHKMIRMTVASYETFIIFTNFWYRSDPVAFDWNLLR